MPCFFFFRYSDFPEGALRFSEVLSEKGAHSLTDWHLKLNVEQNIEITAHNIQQVLTQPFDEQSTEVENKYNSLKPQVFFAAGGVSHYSCSS